MKIRSGGETTSLSKDKRRAAGNMAVETTIWEVVDNMKISATERG